MNYQDNLDNFKLNTRNKYHQCRFSLLFLYLCISYKSLLQTYLSLYFNLTYFSILVCYIVRDFHRWLRIPKKLHYSCVKETIQYRNTFHWLFAKKEYAGITMVLNDSLIFFSLDKFATYMTRQFLLFQKGNQKKSRKSFSIQISSVEKSVLCTIATLITSCMNSCFKIYTTNS